MNAPRPDKDPSHHRGIRVRWQEHRLLFTAFALVVAATVYFILHLVFASTWWADPRHQFQSLEPWMTPRYVAHSWGLTPEELMEIWPLNPQDGRRFTLDEFSRETGLSLTELQALLGPRPLQAERPAE